MPNYHIAQVNIARMVAPLDDPIMADFLAYLSPVNALADSAPGFIWRFQTDAGDATTTRKWRHTLCVFFSHQLFPT